MVNITKIKELCKAKGISQTFVATQLGKYRTFIGAVACGKDNIHEKELHEIAQILGTTVDYLTDKTDDPMPRTKKHGTRIPVLGKVAAGIPIEQILDVDPDDFEDISEDMSHNGDYFALTIKGESMIPEMYPGTNVIVRVQPDVEDGQIAVVSINGDEATCKRVKKIPNGIMLMSFNPAYEPMIFSTAEAEKSNVHILGRVVESRKKW